MTDSEEEVVEKEDEVKEGKEPNIVEREDEKEKNEEKSKTEKVKGLSHEQEQLNMNEPL